MVPTPPAFLQGAVTSSFTPRTVHSATTALRPVPVPTACRPSRVVAPAATPVAIYMEPQPGDPGSKPLPKVPKGFGMDKVEEKKPKKDDDDDDDEKEPSTPEAKSKAKSKDGPSKVTQKTKGFAGRKLPVVGGTFEERKRGLQLLREDLFKSAPEAAGVGRQDASAIMKPLYGEPGYKPAAYETVKVSDLGISPFPDDANAVGKVGGVEAVKKAAVEVKKGEKTAEEVKKEVLKIEVKQEAKVYDIPDYLKPLPEDTPRKGYTWKNYEGR